MIAQLKSWKFWVGAAVVGIALVLIDRASGGAIVNNVPVLGPAAVRAGLPTATP